MNTTVVRSTLGSSINKAVKISLCITAVFCAVYATAQSDKSNINSQKTMKKFEIPALSYSANALAPVISEQTINFHYGKHLQTYINNLNNLIVGTEFENAPLEVIVKGATGPIFNNAAQTWNHQFYFDTFAPESVDVHTPAGKLLAAIEQQWGSLDNFKKEFVTAGTSIFGSGWVWLVKDKDGKLSIEKGANAENPITKGLTPLLTFDVWEHAYYLDYQNRRADQLADLWKIVDWRKVEARY